MTSFRETLGGGTPASEDDVKALYFIAGSLFAKFRNNKLEQSQRWSGLNVQYRESLEVSSHGIPIKLTRLLHARTDRTQRSWVTEPCEDLPVTYLQFTGVQGKGESYIELEPKVVIGAWEIPFQASDLTQLTPEGDEVPASLFVVNTLAALLDRRLGQPNDD